MTRVPSPLGDMDPEEFRRNAHRVADWIADYLANPGRFPVLAQVQPGQIHAALPVSAPERGESFETILSDFERVLLPGITHWNHPGFFAYFAITGSAPGILAEFLSAALNVQAMLWRTSPAATELEEVTLSWLRQLLGLPSTFEGVIYDTASISTLHALAAARERAVPSVRDLGLVGRDDLPRLRVYCSDQTHSSIDKAVILLGLGPDGHTASIFPGSEVLHETKRLVAAPWVEKFQTYRITMTLPLLNNGASVIFLVSGAEKATIVKEVLEGPPKYPAQAIKPTHGELLWMLDKNAASEIK